MNEEDAAFLLREVFDEPYERIAEIVGTSEQNARQLVARARRHVEERRGGRVRFEASREQRDELATRFFAAAEEGDLEGLEELLAHDVVLHADGALFFDHEGSLGGVIILDIADAQIQAVSSIVNPDKLRHLGPVSDLHALRRERM